MALAPRAGVLARKLNQSVAVLSKLVDDLRLKHGDAGSSEDVVWSCRNELDRLHFWDRDHQVLNGYLDHALRESSHLKDQVVELLDELCEIKGEALRAWSSLSAYGTSCGISFLRDLQHPQ